MERIKVHALIKVGQDIAVAQDRIRQAGYPLAYSAPIDPTKMGSYLQQVVVIGRLSFLKTFFDTIGHRNPVQTESCFVVIDATPEGQIKRID